ncbi:Origin recognition complex subunit 2 [Gryganskiella cystojenkinii]|nr:Origin recognition complex subunit 2 [Gryganskiella cystojenkinii]
MGILVYQRNDEIPVHINCRVPVHDAERESILAKKFKKLILPPSQRRKRKIGLDSGLTVPTSSHSDHHQNNFTQQQQQQQQSRRDKNSRIHDDETDAALQDIFLPSSATTRPQQQSSSTKPSTLATSAAAGPGEPSEDPTNKHIRGREVFGFQTTRRKASGLKALIEAQMPQKEAPAPPPPISSAKGKQRTSAVSSADIGESASEREAKRRRVAGTISKMNQTNSDDEDDDEDEDEESESSEEEQADQDDLTVGNSARDATEGHHHHQGQQSIFEEDEMGAEKYFQNLYQKSQTSNNTLSSLPILERSDYTQAMKSAPPKHAQEKALLQMLYEEQFPQWYFELLSGFNLLIYGYGSKRLLLTKFATTVLTDAPVIMVNGYFPTLGIKDIMDKISVGALKYSGPTGTLQEQLAYIHAYFRQPQRATKKIYLLIHNIDGPSLRSEKVQGALSVLASCPSVHLIASVDHINANILWDAVKAARFRWCWHELTTFQPYTAETSYENSIMVQQRDLGPRGIQYVLASLTSNGKGLFKILAEYQIQAEKEGAEMSKSDFGMAYNVLFKKCQENFLVSNQVTFKTQLTEFRDHRIVHSRKGPDGVEILYIPLAASVLEGILEQMS